MTTEPDPLANRTDPPPVTALCIVRVEHPATGPTIVTVTASSDIARVEPSVVGRCGSATEALPLILEFLRRSDGQA